ncbi:hypothetical protein BMS3Abin10_01252 [bacterium BMS3Abin10]|nr:hypothetical protein BMS3Abin10_01252 [bacterium BMS3Abin10]GBE37910.1 hypothetical protein BMS3Bbin08_00509 [bacterium BMS3Bbin08]
MPRIIADLHVHSGYSRATSKDMNVAVMARWAKKKGIDLLGTGDFTHPLHLADLKSSLKPAGNGLYTTPSEPSVFFMLTAEVSSIYSYKGRVRRIHNIIMAPGIDVAEKINRALQKRGVNLSSDGRPIMGIPAKDLLKMVLDISGDCLFVPAHAWTPWFSIFGSKSGFNSIEECFEEYSKHIYAIETGLSSDPEMNWRLPALDNITLLSNSDAHSPGKLGREANVFDCGMDYYEIMDTIRKKDKKRFLYTVEFFPEEGKYHYDGHRLCDVLFSPSQTKEHACICPVCKKPLTVGVMNRVDELADRPVGFVPENAVPSRHLAPLIEIIAGTLNAGVNTVKVKREYERMISANTEFDILLDISDAGLYELASENIADGILKMRKGEIDIIPGYDGVFGRISILSGKPAAGDREKTTAAGQKQGSLF